MMQKVTDFAKGHKALALFPSVLTKMRPQRCIKSAFSAHFARSAVNTLGVSCTLGVIAGSTYLDNSYTLITM